MTRRQLGRQARRHPVLAAAAVALGALAVVDVARAMRWLVAIAAAAAIVYAVRQHRRPARATGPAPVRPATPRPTSDDTRLRTGGPVPAGKAPRGHLRVVADPESPELAELRAENARLRGELDDARQSAMAAWDAAASRPPAPPRDDTRPLAAALLADPLSGVRRLGRG